jgi:hypothetical protein
MVGERMDELGLIARAPEGVQDMVEGTIEDSGTSGQILARAWGNVHAFTPDDSGAYADAVRAVEAAAKPMVEPDNDEATLGGMAGVMRTQGDWRLPLREHQRADRRDDRGDDAVAVEVGHEAWKQLADVGQLVTQRATQLQIVGHGLFEGGHRGLPGQGWATSRNASRSNLA